MVSNERCTRTGFGRLAGGTASRPCTSALGSRAARMLRPRGISIPYRTFCWDASGMPRMWIGAPRWVRNRPSMAANLVGCAV